MRRRIFLLPALLLAFATAALAGASPALASATCTANGMAVSGTHSPDTLSASPTVQCSNGSGGGYTLVATMQFSDNGGGAWNPFTTNAGSVLKADMPVGSCGSASNYNWGSSHTLALFFAGLDCGGNQGDNNVGEKPQPSQNPCAAGRTLREVINFYTAGGTFIKQSISVTSAC